ncbi:hypothetical protein [Gynuella sp.]|uniref:hypothetical protein n=1 Tax=Gynuella sp. TaxID=2969146 RepID=UPI003D0C403A
MMEQPVNRVSRLKWMSLITLTSLLLSPMAWAFLTDVLNAPNPVWGFINNKNLVYGHVYTRGVYKNDNGNPVWVEYNDAGEEVGELGEVTADKAGWSIMAATTYQSYIAQYQNLLNDWTGSDQPTLLSRTDYDAQVGSLTTVDGAAMSGVATALTYPTTTHSVLVLPESLLYAPNTRYVLAEFPVDLTHTSSLSSSDQSLLVNEQGQIQQTSRHRIGLRSIFFVDTTKGNADDRYYSSKYYTDAQRAHDDWSKVTLTNPVKGLGITAPMGFRGGDVTDKDGFFNFYVIGTPCPTFYYGYMADLEAQIPTRHFNPEINTPYWHYLRKLFSFNCNGMGTWNFIPDPAPPQRVDFPIDVNIVSGSLKVPGVTLSDALSYDMALPGTFENITQNHYDFDLDGTDDSSYCGILNSDNLFVTGDCSEATVQGVYLSSRGGNPHASGCHEDLQADGCQPEITRVIDQQSDTAGQQVKVATMDNAALQDTDLYIIREATGDLVMMRQGLKDSERAYAYVPGGSGGVQSASASLKAGYRMLMRGSEDRSQISASYNPINYANFSDWQAKGNMAPQLHSKDSDLIQPGETLLIYAINRQTGYMGYQRVNVEQMSGGSGYLDTVVNDIELTAPNLKIWAERKYTIEAGNNQGETPEYLIGYEGAGEADDTYIQIYTDWVNQDGTAIPEALADYGFTGRVAYSASAYELQDASQVGTARFSIQPGTHAQVIRLPGDNSGNQHFYVQAFGVPYGEYQDFALGSQSRGLDSDNLSGVAENAYRPKRFVPVKVPLYDETNSELQTLAYRLIKQERKKNDESTEDLDKPIPLFDWVARPEYQFSVYGLTVNSIDRESGDGTENLLDSDEPAITFNDPSLDVSYSILFSGNESLTSYQGGQDLILNIAGQEVLLSLGENNQITADLPEYLPYLTSDDYLTASIYLNQDSQNLLWEFAFGVGPGLFPEQEVISVDNNELDLTAILPVDLSTPEEERGDITLKWEVAGSGHVENRYTTANDGKFDNKLVVNTTAAGENVFVTVSVYSSDNANFPEGSEKQFGPYQIIAGQPSSIQLIPDDQYILASGVDTSHVVATVKDQYGNDVMDGTPISWSADYGFQILNDDRYVVGGQASADVLADVELLSGNVTATVNAISESKEFHKRELTTELQASSDNAQPGDTITVTYTLSEAPQEALPVLWHATRGTLVGPETVSGTQVQATLVVGNDPGDGLISAAIEGHPDVIGYTVTGTSPDTVEVDLPAIASAAVETDVAVETLTGSNNYTPPNSTGIHLTGAPGSTKTIQLGGLYTPNGRAVVQMGLDDIFNHALDDSSLEDAAYNAAMGTYAPVSGDITVDYNNAYTNPGASFLFSGDADDTVILPASPDINLQDQLALNLRIRPDAESGRHITEDDGTEITPLVRKGSNNDAAYRIDLEKRVDDDLFRIRVTLKTATAEYQLSSEPLIQPKQWNLIGIQLQDNVLTLGVGAARFYSSVSEPLIAQSVNSPLVLGNGFKGHIDDVRLFNTAQNNAVLQFADGSQTQTLTFDGNGKATATIKATGNTVATHQRVGFSEFLDGTSVASSGYKRELNVASRAMGRLLPFSMRQAWADDISGVQQINQLEQGVAVVNNSEFAQAMDFIKSAGKEVYDLFKQAAEMLFDLSGFSDVWTIGKAIYLWMDDRFDEVDKFDLVFAGIGLTLTVVAVITAPAGGGSTLALKGSLRGLKALLKECVSDPVMLLKAGGTAVNWTFKLLKDFFSGPAGREKALASLVDLKDLLTDMFSTGGKTLLTLFTKVVRAPAQFKAMLKLRKISKLAGVCSIAAGPVQTPSPGMLAWARVTGLSLVLTVQPAYAANYLCGEDLTKTLLDVFGDKGEQFTTVVNSLESLSSVGKLSISANTIRKMADLADAGYLQNLESWLKAVEEGKVATYFGETTNMARLAETAVDNSTGALLDISRWDYLVDRMHSLLQYEDRVGADEVRAFMSNLNPQGEGLKISILQLKRVVGEANGLESVLQDAEYLQGTLTLTHVNPRLNDPYIATRKGKEGVDNTFDWITPDGTVRPLNVESKNFSGSAYRTNKAASLKSLDKQFMKHLQEEVINRINSIDDGVVTWKGEINADMPRLDYRLSGGFWDQADTTAVDIRERFKKIFVSGEFDGKEFTGSEKIKTWLEDMTEEQIDAVLDDLLKINILQEQVPPFTS